MTGARILIVEDEAITAKNLESQLLAAGHTVTATVFSGEEALHCAIEQTPDLVLMDIQLQGSMDGIEAAERIHTRCDVPVVYLTAHADRETLQRAKITEPFGYVVKPFDPPYLHSVIEMALYKHRLDQRLKESEARYRALSELISDFAYSYLVQPDGTWVGEWATSAVYPITGFSPVQPSSWQAWQHAVHPADREAVHAHLQALAAGQAGVCELRIRDKDGTQRWLRNYARPVYDQRQARVTHIYGAAQDVTSRKEMEEALQRRSAQLEALQQIGLELAVELDLDVLLRSVVTQAVKLLDGTSGSFSIYRPEREVVESIVSVGPNPVPLGGTLPRGEGLAGRVWETGQPLSIENYPQWEGRSAKFAGLPLGAAHAVPIFRRDEFLGVVMVNAETARTFSAEDIEMMGMFATQVAIALQNSRLFQAERQARTLSEALAGAAGALNSTLDLDQVLDRILEQVERVVPGDAFNIMLIEGDVARVVRLRGYQRFGSEEVIAATTIHIPSVPLMQRMRDEGAPLLIPDSTVCPEYVKLSSQQGLRSYAAAPIVVRDQVIGFLNVDSATPGFFNTSHLAALRAFADHAAAAIQNAQLYAEVRRELAERRQVEQELHEAKEFLTHLLELAPVPIYVTLVDQRMHMVNRAWEKFAQNSREAVVGRSLEDIFPAAVARQLAATNEDVVRAGLPSIREERFDGTDGPHYFHAIRFPLHDTAGVVEAIGGISIDITDRKRAEDALAASESFLRSTFDAIQDGISVTDAALNILQVNRTTERWYHHAMPLVGKKCFVVYQGRSEPCADCPALRAIDIGTLQMNLSPIRRAGQVAQDWHEVYAYPLRDGAGRTTGVVTYVRDVSERKRAEEALQESEERYRHLAWERAALLEQARQDAETKARLLGEVNHRVKNNLSALIGLLHAELRYAGAEEQAAYQAIVQEMTQRIEGLARVHTMLSAAHWAPLPLDKLAREIVQGALKTVPRNKRVAVDVAPSSVRVTAQEANNLALVLHELVTNSVKYALAGRDRAQVTLRIVHEGRDVLLEYRDDGPGYPEDVLQQGSRNLGLHLVKTISRHDLRGEATLFNDGGAVTTIRFTSNTAPAT